MPTVTTEGLILKRKDFGEADRVLTALCRRFGKISIIARGVRKVTSRRAGNVEVLNLVKMHLFKSRNYTLTEAEALETFPRIKDNLTLSASAFHIIELVDRLVPEGEKNERIFDLTVAVLKALEENPRQIFIRAFEVKLLTLLGFWAEGAVSPDLIGAKDLDYQNHPRSNRGLYLLELLSEKSWEEIAKMELSADEAIELERVLRYYIERILESSLKSAKVLEKLRK